MKPECHTFSALGGSNELLAYGEPELVRRAFTAVETEVRRIEAKFSRYRSESIISQVNAAAGFKPVSVDEETAALFSYADQCFRESDQLFDITSGVLRKVWDFKAKKVPNEADLAKVLPLIGWEKISWKAPDIFLPTPGMEVDLGGIGKEYAADRAAFVATNCGLTSVLINLGGDIRALGPKPDGRPWEVGIKHPREDRKVLANLKLTTSGLATSGDYERFFVVAGQRYCHILNPKTGWPVSDLQSVTVVAPICLVAGTLATATMLLGRARGVAKLKAAKVSGLVVTHDGSLIEISQ